jgi:hypothetical protein
MDDAVDAVGMLVRLGRVVPAGKWVPELIDQARAANWEAIGVR